MSERLSSKIEGEATGPVPLLTQTERQQANKACSLHSITTLSVDIVSAPSVAKPGWDTCRFILGG